MKIEAGKYYRTRDGQKVGPMALPKPDDIYRWNVLGLKWGRFRDDGEDGNATGGTFQAGSDLISEWSEPMDLTAITTPFGLLDRETQEAMKAHGGPWEFLNTSGDWDELESPVWGNNSTYRVKPAPPKPREWWLCAGRSWSSEVDARSYAQTLHSTAREITHVIEKLP